MLTIKKLKNLPITSYFNALKILIHMELTQSQPLFLTSGKSIYASTSAGLNLSCYFHKHFLNDCSGNVLLFVKKAGDSHDK